MAKSSRSRKTAASKKLPAPSTPSATAKLPAKVQPSGLPHGLKPEDIKPVEAPMFHVVGVHMQGTGNEFTIIFTRSRPATLASSGDPAPVAMAEPVVILSLSPQSLKDLGLIAAEQIAGHEKLFGEIVTPFMQLREAAKKTKH